MPGSNSNLYAVDGHHAVVTTTAIVTTKRKEEDATAAAQAAAAATHREQEALVVATCKTLDKARAHERAAALTWEKEKTITPHLEQQLTAAQGIMIPQDDGDDHSINVSSNPNATLTTLLHAQAVGLHNI
jgi:hypothetical protein